MFDLFVYALHGQKIHSSIKGERYLILVRRNFTEVAELICFSETWIGNFFQVFTFTIFQWDPIA